jgi:hypothetical protein
LLGKQTVEVEDLRIHEKDVSNLYDELNNFAWKMGGRRAAQKTTK